MFMYTKNKIIEILTLVTLDFFTHVHRASNAQ